MGNFFLSSHSLSLSGTVKSEQLRLRWAWNYAYGHGKGDFGPFARPQDGESARYLRNALTSIAQRRRPPAAPNWKEMYGGKSRFGFLLVEEAEEFTRVRALASDLLLDHNALEATAYWYVYGEPSTDSLPRFYRLQFSYRCPSLGLSERGAREAGAELPELELWILFHSRLSDGGALIEAAWQRYILGWIETTALRCEPLEEALTGLVHALQ